LIALLLPPYFETVNFFIRKPTGLPLKTVLILAILYRFRTNLRNTCTLLRILIWALKLEEQERVEPMNKKRGFTLIELIVVIAILALLMSILLPALVQVRKQVLLAPCQARLKQWGSVYSMYTNDNDGYFCSIEKEHRINEWPYVYKPYYNDPMMRFCPAADNTNRTGGSFGVWCCDYYAFEMGKPYPCVPGENGPPSGSYGENRWISNRLDYAYANESGFWRRVGYKNSAQVPVLMDAQYLLLWGTADAQPPEHEGCVKGGDNIGMACINRHNGFINCLFMDWSVRKVALKQLWTLKWSRTYDTCGPWTICGNGGDKNACAAKWDAAALWMKDFPEY
jgi:prepilin-type N-terminal cleavage/methylation domain-containing protein/prepilin-type processing-associated H-X9-DG protein